MAQRRIRHSTFNIQHSSFSNLQNNLPKRLPLLQHPLPLADLIERQHTIDHWTQMSCLDMLHDLVQLGQATHRRAEDGEELEEDEADVDGRLGAAGGAAGDEAA